MPALSQTLVSILDACLRAGATHADLSRTLNVVRIARGDEALGEGALPAGAWDALVAELGALGARADTRSLVTVHSPVGPLELSIEMAPTAIRIALPRDAKEAEGEAEFSALVAQLDSLGADRVECAKGRASFLRGRELVAVAPLAEAAVELLVAHGRAVATIQPGESAGSAVLMATGAAPRVLRVEIVEGGVAFSIA